MLGAAAARSHALDFNPLRAGVASCRTHLWAVGIFSALLNLLYIAPTIYMLQVYDRVVPTRGTLTLLFLTMILALSLVVLSSLDLVRSRLLVRASMRLDRLIAPPIIDALLKSPQAARASATLREFDTLRAVLAGPGTLAFLDAPWTPIYIALSFLIHPALGAMAAAGSATMLVVAFVNERAVRQPTQRAAVASSAAYTSLDQSMTIADTVQALGMRPSLMERHLKQRDAANGLLMPASFVAGRYVSITKFLRQLIQSLALGLGALLAVQGSISAGAIFAASLLVTRALAPIELIVANWRNLISARATWRDLNQLLDGHGGAAKTLLPTPAGRLSVENVCVRVSGEGPPILADVSFNLEPGESLGIVGASGAGKSTLARAISGAVTLAAGAVRLDGARLDVWDEGQLGAAIGYAPQQPHLLVGSIKENIARFDPLMDADPAFVDDEVVQAAMLCGAHEMILRLPKGYETWIGVNGQGVSVGQATRIALARAFYRAPPILILDEPNAALDTEGEAGLMAALDGMRRRGVTQIIVAHRTSIIANVDKLLVLESGQVRCFGKREDVIAAIMTADRARTEQAAYSKAQAV